MYRGERLNSISHLIGAAVAAAGLAVVRLRRRSDFRYQLDRLKLRVPFGRTIWLESGLSLFSRTLGLLLEAGISLHQAVQGEALAELPAGVREGLRTVDTPIHLDGAEKRPATRAPAEP